MREKYRSIQTTFYKSYEETLIKQTTRFGIFDSKTLQFKLSHKISIRLKREFHLCGQG